MTVREYQNTLKIELERIFNNIEIISEWRTRINQFNLYSPRLDLALGPFAISSQEVLNYNRLQEDFRDFINHLILLHNQNLREIYHNFIEKDFYDVVNSNINARCFIAIEIENKGSRKHYLGSVINASSLGRIGICIGFSEETFRALVKLEGYFNFLKNAEKNTFNTKNVLILKRDQFLDYIKQVDTNNSSSIN